MEVTRENVPEAVAALRTALQGARFCAVDLEMVRAARLERKGAATNFLRPLASRASRRPPTATRSGRAKLYPSPRAARWRGARRG